MKQALSFFALVAIAMAGPVAGQSINVVQPGAGDLWVIGASHEIRWTHAGFANPAAQRLHLRLRRGNQVVCLIADGVPLDQLHFTWDSATCTGLQPGTYQVRLRVGAGDDEIIGDGAPFEMKVLTVFHPPPQLKIGALAMRPPPDLRVKQCWTVPADPLWCDEIEIHARLHNAGKGPTMTSCDCRIDVVGPSGFTPLSKTFRVPRLGANAFHEIVLPFTATQWGRMEATVTLDTQSEIGELDEANNGATCSFYVVNPIF